MAWPTNPRPAKSLPVLLAQVDERWPNRDKSSDGMLAGDAHHAANPDSDHEPWVIIDGIGVVTAIDFTNDPAHGLDSRKLAETLIASHDSRIKYVISNHEIASGTGQKHPAWVWRPYSGPNPHTEHCHISVKSEASICDDVSSWNLSGEPGAPIISDHPTTQRLPVLKEGDQGPAVVKLQNLLVDGFFGAGTKQTVINFQKQNNLAADGIVGTYTWKALLKTTPVTPVTPVIPPASADQLRLSGKVSWFGGPNDTGVTASEGLAFIDSVSDQPSIFLSAQPTGTTGLARRLDPAKFYIACRWDYKRYPKSTLLHHQATVSAPKTGRSCAAWPADWGPNENTGRVADISPGLMSALGITTDDTVEVVYPAGIPAVTPKEPPMADPTPTIPPPVIVTAPPPSQPARDWAHTGLAAIVVLILGWLGITVPDKLAAPNPATEQTTIDNVVQAAVNPQNAGLIIKDPKTKERFDLALLKAIQSGVPGQAIQVGAGAIPYAGGIISKFEPLLRQIAEEAVQKRLEQNQNDQTPAPAPAPRPTPAPRR